MALNSSASAVSCKLVTWMLASTLVASTAIKAAAASNVHNFSFQSKIEYELSTNVVPAEFCDPNSPLSLSGYFSVEGSKYDKKNSKHYFYWMFERRSKSLLTENEQSTKRKNESDDKPIPFVIWLNGGPGCSSMLGLLQENGPCLVNKDGHSTTLNPYSWTEVAHVLYLDQPAKTGYSYGEGNDDNEEMVAEDAYYFLQSFFQSTEGGKYKDLPLFLTGESYAGHYIPAIAHRIRKGNRDHHAKDFLHLPLSGLSIGNGAFDIEEQMKWYSEMAFHNPHGLKIISKNEYENMKNAAVSCARDAHNCKKKEDSELEKELMCQKASNCEEGFFTPILDKNISIYDITKPCIGSLCEDMTPIQTFLNLCETKEALGVPAEVTWEACDDSVGDIWSDVDRVANFAPYISELLGEIPVLIYAGDLDYICNFMGNRAVVLKLEWDHGDDFRSSDDHDWNGGGGLVRSSNGLTFLQVYDAGHMVPQDQPKQALQMITQFLNGETF
ncbi:hypothetical protein ACHAXR_003494 [Thalassiosira sp. AJA248-18]